MIIKNAKIFDGEKFIDKNTVLIEDKTIKKILNENELSQKEISDNEIIDIQGMVLSPGFIDLQLNGCGGVLFNDDTSENALKIMNETNKKFGCTSFLPTLITSPDNKILNALEVLKNIDNPEEKDNIWYLSDKHNEKLLYLNNNIIKESVFWDFILKDLI